MSRTEHLLFLILDQLRLGNWMSSKDGHKGRNRPPPLSPLAKAGGKGEKIGRTDLAPMEVARLLAAAKEGRPMGDGQP